MTDEDDSPRDALLFDRSFRIEKSNERTYAFEIYTTSRSLSLRAKSREHFDAWHKQINLALSKCEFSNRVHPHSSFAPFRDTFRISALVDGSDYFAAVATAMEMAASEIFIAGWWVAPDVPLRRGPSGPTVTLREIIREVVARRNVKV
jgi:phospholipase D1/2